MKRCDACMEIILSWIIMNYYNEIIKNVLIRNILKNVLQIFTHLKRIGNKKKQFSFFKKKIMKMNWIWHLNYFKFKKNEETIMMIFSCFASKKKDSNDLDESDFGLCSWKSLSESVSFLLEAIW